MAQAKKKTTKKRAKAPKTKKKTSNKVNDFLSKPSVSPKSKPTSSREKDIEKVPEEYAQSLEICVASKIVEKAAKRKGKLPEKEIKDFFLYRFAKEWAKNGKRPKSKKWAAKNGQIDHIMTKSIRSINNQKIKSLKKECDIDLLEHLKLNGFSIDLEVLQGNEKYFNAFQEFLSVFSKEDLHSDEYVKRLFKPKDDFFDQLGDLCEFDGERIYDALSILEPTAQLKNPNSSESEEELFNRVMNEEG